MEQTKAGEAADFFTSELRRHVEGNMIRYLVQKQMFCKVTGAILDYETCIVVEVYEKKDGQMLSISAFSPSIVDTLDNIIPGIHKFFPEAEVKFYTLNKKLNHPLLTKI